MRNGMATLSDNARGALLMMLSMASFSIGDACIKLIGSAMPLSQLLFLRGLLASCLIFALAQSLGAVRWRIPRHDAVLIGVRSLAEVGAAYFFLTALFHMPLANVTAILQVLPLTVTLGAALVFREQVGWRRWSAIAIGFVGMLLIVKPGGDAFNTYTIFALLAVVCVTIRDLSTRRMSGHVPSLTVTLWASLTVTVFAGLAMLGQSWAPVATSSALLVLATAVCIIGGYLFSVMVMRVGEISFIAPFRYTGLVWALCLGWLIFGEWPDVVTLIGAAIVVVTGLYTLARNAVRRDS